jgi:hypothetical protein
MVALSCRIVESNFGMPVNEHPLLHYFHGEGISGSGARRQFIYEPLWGTMPVDMGYEDPWAIKI